MARAHVGEHVAEGVAVAGEPGEAGVGDAVPVGARGGGEEVFEGLAVEGPVEAAGLGFPAVFVVDVVGLGPVDAGVDREAAAGAPGAGFGGGPALEFTGFAVPAGEEPVGFSEVVGQVGGVGLDGALEKGVVVGAGPRLAKGDGLEHGGVVGAEGGAGFEQTAGGGEPFGEALPALVGDGVGPAATACLPGVVDPGGSLGHGADGRLGESGLPAAVAGGFGRDRGVGRVVELDLGDVLKPVIEMA